jgi:branched-chain amino acid transport system substrate-binding protein
MKKALSVLLTAAMAASMMAGCGSSSDGAASGTTTDNGAAAGTESAGAAEADGAAFKIGGIGPTTGAAAIYGTAVMNGAQIAVDEINAAGGINGYQIAYKFEDDQHDAEKSVNAYNSLKDWGMQMLMGTVTTTPCVAVVEKTAEDGMYELTPSASSTDVIDNDNVFQVCFTDPNQGTASAQYIGENKLAAKVAVIYDSSDVYSSGIYERCFKQNGKFYHHILDPSTGYPVDNTLMAVTILSKASVDGDGLSTTCFGLGLEKGMELIDSLDNVEAVFVTKDEKMHYSKGYAKYRAMQK